VKIRCFVTEKDWRQANKARNGTNPRGTFCPVSRVLRWTICPVARALRRTTGLNYFWVGYSEFGRSGLTEWRAKLTKQMLALRQAFDNGEPYRRANFTVEIPEGAQK
jgi:hypothetical protein